MADTMSRISKFRSVSRAAFVALTVGIVAGCSSPQERAQSYYQRGKQLQAQHDSKRAEIEFLNAVKYNDKLLPAWKSLAEVEEADRNWRGLAGALHNIVELDPNDLSARLKLGRLELMGGAYNDALSLVNDVKAPDDQNPDLLALKAAILFKLDDTSAAANVANQALKIDPKNVGALFVLAGDDLAHGDTKGALAILENPAIKKQKTPEIGTELFKLRVLEQAQNLPQAEALLQTLVEAYPKYIAFRRELIRLYLFEHRNADAIKEQRAVVAQNSNDTQAQLELAKLLDVTEGTDSARKRLEALIKAGGDVFPYQIALAQLDFTAGHFSDSVVLLQNLIKNDSAPNNVIVSQLQLAQMYLAKEQVDAAESLVSDVLHKDARNTTGLKLRASIAMDRGKLEDAIADLRQALNDQPRDTSLMLMLATAYERSGSIDLAEKEYADAMQTSNHNPTDTLPYVAFLQRRGDIAHAEDVLTDLASRWPKDIKVLTALGQIRLARQEWAGAQEIAETIKRLSGNQTLANELLGASLAGEEKYSESLSALQNAYAEQPTATQPMFAMVRVYLSAHEPEKAVAFLQSVLKASPDNADAYVLLGSVQLSQTQLDQAKKSFETAIQKQPTNGVGYRGLSELYEQQNDNDAAIKVLRDGLKQAPDDFMLQLALAGALERAADYDGAITEYQNMFKKDPGSVIVANNLASLLADHRTDKDSLAQAEALAAVLQKSPVPQFRDTLGWVRYRQQDYKSALSLLEDAANALPKDPTVHYHLAMTYLALGQNGKSSDQFQAALTLAPSNDLQQKIKRGLAKIGTN